MAEFDIPGEWQDVPLAHVRANPHRDLTRYPLQDVRVEELRGSVRQHGQLDRVYGRKAKGKAVEIAFGHHLRAAVEAEGLGSLRVKVCDLSDAEMLRLMAAENGENYNLQVNHVLLVVEKAREFIEGRIFAKFATLDDVLKSKSANEVFEGMVPGNHPPENGDHDLQERLIEVFGGDGSWEKAAQSYLDQRNGRDTANGFTVGASRRAIHRFVGSGLSSEKTVGQALKQLTPTPWQVAALDLRIAEQQAAQAVADAIAKNREPVEALLAEIDAAVENATKASAFLGNADKTANAKAKAALNAAKSILSEITDAEFAAGPVPLPDLTAAFNEIADFVSVAVGKQTEAQEAEALKQAQAGWLAAAGKLLKVVEAGLEAHAKGLADEAKQSEDAPLPSAEWLALARKRLADGGKGVTKARATVTAAQSKLKLYQRNPEPAAAYVAPEGLSEALKLLTDYRAGMKLAIAKQKQADKEAAEIDTSLASRFGSSISYWNAFADVARKHKLDYAAQAEAVDDLLASLSLAGGKVVWDGPQPPLTYCGVRGLPITVLREDIVRERVTDRLHLIEFAKLNPLPVSAQAFWLLPSPVWRRDYLKLSQTPDFRKLAGTTPEEHEAWIVDRLLGYGPGRAADADAGAPVTVLVKSKDGKSLNFNMAVDLKKDGWFASTVAVAINVMKNPLLALSPEVRALIDAMGRTQKGIDAAIAGFRAGSKLLKANAEFSVPSSVMDAFRQRIEVLSKEMEIFTGHVGKEIKTFDDDGVYAPADNVVLLNATN